MCMWIPSMEKTNMQNEIYFGRDLISDEVLQHYGMPRRSGRYPWGSGEDPYHHGASAPGGKKSSSIKERLKRKAAVRESVKKAKAEAIERKEKEERERKKEAAIKSGDPRQLAPFIRDLSDDELKEATNRLRLENDFMNKLSEASRFNKSTADKVEAKVKKLNSYTSTGIDAWNNYAKIANAFRDEEDQLPILGSNKSKDKDKEKKKDKSDKSGNNDKNDKKESKPPLVENVENDDRKELAEYYKKAGGEMIEYYAPRIVTYDMTDSSGKKVREASYMFSNDEVKKLAPRKKVPKLKR